MAEGEKIGFGFYPNKKRKDSSNMPTLLVWMKNLDGGFVEENPGALWLSVGDDCPEDKKAGARKFIDGLCIALDKKWLRCSGSLKTQVLMDILAELGGGASDPFDTSPPAEDPEELPFKECP